MPKKNYKCVHILHLLLYAPVHLTLYGDLDQNIAYPITGRTRLMKMMYLFEQEVQQKFLNPSDNISSFDFEAYNFGPFSTDVLEAVDFLNAKHMLTISISYSQIGRADDVWESNMRGFENDNLGINDYTHEIEKYTLSGEGKKVITSPQKWFSWTNLTEPQREILVRFKTSIIHKTLQTILHYVYTRYPDSTKNSLIKNQVLGEYTL